jgi:alkanesulfonate monooxygenase SsuD/methylene tetrahydromethanopterin reductase-like flavin-dependent oxidoreductase (luciferase family)
MRTGVFLPATIPGTTSGQLVAYARAAEDHGFAGLAVSGRVIHDCYEPLVALTLAAVATRRIELVTLVQAAPLHHRGILSRQGASLDRVSGGRLTVAVGGDRGDAVDLTLDELTGRRTLVTGDPHAAARTIATRAGGWVQSSGTAAAFEAGYLAVHDAWACAGRPGTPRGVAVLHAALGDDVELLALTASAPVATTMDAVREHLAAFEKAGASDVLVCPCSSDLRRLDLLAKAALGAPALV